METGTSKLVVKHLHKIGCENCNVQPVRVPCSNGEEAEVLTNVCDRGAALRTNAIGLLKKAERARTIGERDSFMDAFKRSRQRFFDHAMRR